MYCTHTHTGPSLSRKLSHNRKSHLKTVVHFNKNYCAVQGTEKAENMCDIKITLVLLGPLGCDNFYRASEIAFKERLVF